MIVVVAVVVGRSSRRRRRRRRHRRRRRRRPRRYDIILDVVIIIIIIIFIVIVVIVASMQFWIKQHCSRSTSDSHLAGDSKQSENKDFAGIAAEMTEGTSDDTHLAADSERQENAAGTSGYAPPVQEERRVAGDGNSYTFQEFLDHYGEEWIATYKWSAAQDTPPPAPQPQENVQAAAWKHFAAGLLHPCKRKLFQLKLSRYRLSGMTAWKPSIRIYLICKRFISEIQSDIDLS